MSLKDTVEARLEDARRRVEKYRGRYFSASAKVVEQGSERLSGLTRITNLFGPKMRETINDRISEVQAWLDELNRSLAEKAIPDDRREKVGKLNGKKRRPLRVVQGGQSGASASSQAASASKSKAATSKSADSTKPGTRKGPQSKTAKGSTGQTKRSASKTKSSSTAGKKTSQRKSDSTSGSKKGTTRRKTSGKGSSGGSTKS